MKGNFLPDLIAGVYTEWKNHTSLAHATSLRDKVIDTASVVWIVPWGKWWQSVGRKLILLETAQRCHLVAPWDAASAVCFSPHSTASLGRSGAVLPVASKGPWATSSLGEVLLIPFTLHPCGSLCRCLCLITQICHELIVLHSHSMATNVGHPSSPRISLATIL